MNHYYFQRDTHSHLVSTVGETVDPETIPEALVFSVDDEAIAQVKGLISQLPPSSFIQLKMDLSETTQDESGVERIDPEKGPFYNAYLTVGAADNSVLEVEFESEISGEVVIMEIQLSDEMQIPSEKMSELQDSNTQDSEHSFSM